MSKHTTWRGPGARYPDEWQNDQTGVHWRLRQLEDGRWALDCLTPDASEWMLITECSRRGTAIDRARHETARQIMAQRKAQTIKNP